VIAELPTLVVATLVSVVSPAILAVITGWQRKSETLLNWARQDKVADAAAEAARLLVIDNRKVAAAAVEATAAMRGDMAVIHTLVNSNLTEEMKLRMEANQRTLSAMRRLEKKTAEDMEEIAGLMQTVHDLGEKLASRNKSADTAAKQIEIQADKAIH
jgi:hypothetical protein